ncbi:MAG: DUF2058 family protein [Lysobacterales bacterium]
MGLSLRDQLIQAGFQAKPEPKPEAKKPPHKPQAARPGERRPEHARPASAKPAQPAPAKARVDGEPSLAHAYQIRAEAEKREREEAQRRAQEEAQRKREQRQKLAQLVAGQALNDPAGEHVRNFTYGRKIRKVNVTPAQLLALNAGELGVVQVDGRFLILAPERVRDVLALAPQHVALFVPEGIGASASSDEDYSDPRFQVPDDLIW